jgi:hypothetical protein
LPRIKEKVNAESTSSATTPRTTIRDRFNMQTPLNY